MNSNNTTWLSFKGGKYLLSGDHQKKSKKKKKSPTDSTQSEPQEPEGKKKRETERILSPALSSSGAFWATQI